MDILTALFSGLLAAFTPCVIVLIPALIYRFSNEKKPIPEIIKFSLSFLIVYILSALFLAELFSSQIRYGLQLGLGILFIVMGILALLKRFNPLNFHLIKNTWLFGIVFAIIISVNPCVFAYLGILLGTTNTTMLPINMTAFAIGLLLPALVVAIFGNKLLTKINKASKIMHHVSNLMNGLLIIIGAYMIYTIKNLGKSDIIVTGLLLILTFIIILRSFYFLQGKKQLLKLKNILLFTALIIILLAITFHCDSHIKKNTYDALDPDTNPFHINNALQTQTITETPQPTCSSNVTTCKVCTRCITIFSLGALIGFLAILLTHHWPKSLNKQKP